MKTSSKAWLVLVVLVLIVAVGMTVIVVGMGAIARHVPTDSVLAIEISGPIPERPPESPFGGLLGPHVVALSDLRDALVRAAGDDRIVAVRVKVGDLETGFATVQEIRGLLDRVAKAGKRTAAYMDTAGEFAPGNLQYYLASACERVVLNPLGDVNLTGLAAREPHIRGTLDKLGILPDFPGIGAYKTARFFFTEKDFTPADREMTGWLLDSLSSQLAAGIAAGRHMTVDQVKALVAGGPYLGPAALKVKLVDELADWSSFVEEFKGAHGEELEEISLARYLRAGRPDRSGTTIAVLVADGGIVRGESGYSPVPLFGGDMMGSDTIARAWHDVRHSDARAVIFRINSPGGSAIASEIIREEMARTAKTIPVVVSMADVAGSGGYWITCGAQKIVADPASLTASIGVFGGHLAMSRFWEDKLGVTWGRLDAAPNAAIFGSLDPWTPEQRAVVQKFLDRIYDAFVERVSSSRRMTREQVNAVGQGRVFTGEQAKQHGLVDELGGFDVALAAAKQLAGLRPDAPVELVTFPRVKPFWQRLLDREDDSATVAAALRAIQAGQTPAPGVAWMPPLEIR